MKLQAPKAETNNNDKRGALASDVVVFGNGRYEVAAVHTRYQDVRWFVWDHTKRNQWDSGSEVVRQEPTFEQAIAGLAE